MTWRAPQHEPGRELRDHAPEERWREAVREVLARHGLDPAHLAPFATGSDVVWGTREHVVKLTAPRWADEIATEARVLAHVRGRLDVETPEPLATGTLDGWPYVVMCRVEGRALGEAWATCDHGRRLVLARGLGRVTRALHELPPPNESRAFDPFWTETLKTVARNHARGLSPAHLLEEVPSFLERVGPLPTTPRVLCHTELLDQHALVADRDGAPAVVALIDFADARVAPAAYDFAAPVEFVFRGLSGALDAFLDGYGDAGPRDAARSRTMLAWGLCHRFGSLARMVERLGPPVPRDLDELATRLYAFAPGAPS